MSSEEQLAIMEKLINLCNDGYAYEVIESFVKYHGMDLLDQGFKDYLIEDGLLYEEN